MKRLLSLALTVLMSTPFTAYGQQKKTEVDLTKFDTFVTSEALYITYDGALAIRITKDSIVYQPSTNVIHYTMEGVNGRNTHNKIDAVVCPAINGKRNTDFAGDIIKYTCRTVGFTQ